MMRKFFNLTMAAAVLFGFVFAGCAGGSGGDDSGSGAATNVQAISDYSQITVTWEGTVDEDTGFFVYASKNNDTAALGNDDKKDYFPQNNTSSFTVDEPGHYYVWIRTKYDGPFSDPAEVDVTFMNPATNIVVTPAILGFEVSWTNPLTDSEDMKDTAVYYKKTGDETWTHQGYSFTTSQMSLQGMEDGEYTFKVMVQDKYKTPVYSEETSAYTFAFESDKYGNEPATSMYTENNFSPITKKFKDGEYIDYYKINCEKGKTYEFEVLDYWSYSEDRLLGSIKQNNLASLSLYVYISGACPESGNDITKALNKDEGCVLSKTAFYKNGYKANFKCPRTGWYIVQARRSSSYGNEYGIDLKKQN